MGVTFPQPLYVTETYRPEASAFEVLPPEDVARVRGEVAARGGESVRRMLRIGNYELTGLMPGQQYIVVEVLQDDWFQSDPANDVLDGGLTPVGETLGEGGYVITLDSGETEPDNDFGNYQTATKTGRKYHDLNADGDDEGGTDPGLAGWTIEEAVRTAPFLETEIPPKGPNVRVEVEFAGE